MVLSVPKLRTRLRLLGEMPGLLHQLREVFDRQCSLE